MFLTQKGNHPTGKLNNLPNRTSHTRHDPLNILGTLITSRHESSRHAKTGTMKGWNRQENMKIVQSPTTWRQVPLGTVAAREGTWCRSSHQTDSATVAGRLHPAEGAQLSPAPDSTMRIRHPTLPPVLVTWLSSSQENAQIHFMYWWTCSTRSTNIPSVRLFVHMMCKSYFSALAVVLPMSVHCTETSYNQCGAA